MKGSSPQNPPSNIQTEAEKQAEFYNQLNQMGGQSPWLAMIYALMCIPSFCHVMLTAAFAKVITCTFRSRCRIYQLEHKNWTFEEMLRISAPATDAPQSCVYYNYDYNKIANMTFDKALEYIESIDIPSTSPCNLYIHEGCNIYTVYEGFSLVCNRIHFREILNISPEYGKMIACLFVLPLGDILGRKRLLQWGANLYLFGCPFMCLTRSVAVLIFCRFVLGMAFSIMIHSMEAIVIELSNAQLRTFRFLTLRLGIGCGYVLMPVFAKKILHWRLLQWTVSASVTLLPLITWYVPESPRWLMSKAKKAKAWAILRTIEYPVDQSELLTIFRNEQTDLGKNVKQHFKEFRPLATSKLWLSTMLFMFFGSVYFKNYNDRFEIKSNTSRAIHLFLSGFAEIFGYLFCLPFLLVVGRKPTMILTFFCSSVCYGVMSQLELDSVDGFVLLLLTELSTAALYVTVYLYIAESVPTSHRCTAVGISSGLGAGFSALAMYHIYQVITEKTLFIILSCICLAGVIGSFFAQESQNGSIYDTVEETIRPHNH